MANLSINIGGLELKNPIVVASGPLTSRIDRLKAAEDHGAAAVCLKHTLRKQQFIAKPRWYVERNIGIVVSGDPRLEIEEAVELVHKGKQSTDLKIIVNMSALPTDINTWGELAREFENAGADAIELNLNCPNLHSAQASGPTLGANLGQDPESVAKVIANVKNSINIPVIAKLPTEGGRILQVAKAAAEADVNILNIHAGFRAAPGLDIYNGGAFKYPGSSAGNFGGMSGPWSRLISNRFIADIAKMDLKPVMGGGGMSTWEHVVESIMYGALSVQICTAIMFEGFSLIEKILKGLSTYMEKMNYASIEDFHKLALKNVLGPHQMRYTEIAAFIDFEKCTGCRKCEKLPTCDAIAYIPDSKKCQVDPKCCVGCGLCVGICPFKAISIIEK
jgi:dihydroorotate dehydrogenase subfamily 1